MDTQQSNGSNEKLEADKETIRYWLSGNMSEVRKLLLQNYPKELVEEVENEFETKRVYCPRCSSCGEGGCCTPEQCKFVQSIVAIVDGHEHSLSVDHNHGFYCMENLISYIQDLKYEIENLQHRLETQSRIIQENKE